jgi:cyanamide hydratase
MLHDIGTAAEFVSSTRLSFEFWGGYHALELLQDPTITGGGEGVAPREQAESVAEAIIRHSDIQDKGYITLVTRLIHLGTLLDNIGANAELINKQAIENVSTEYPRPRWSGCFTRALGKEKAFNPYAMVARIEGFEGMIEKNGSGEGLMARYD